MFGGDLEDVLKRYSNFGCDWTLVRNETSDARFIYPKDNGKHSFRPSSFSEKIGYQLPGGSVIGIVAIHSGHYILTCAMPQTARTRKRSHNSRSSKTTAGCSNLVNGTEMLETVE